MKLFSTTEDHVAVKPVKRVERITTRGVVLPAEVRDPFVMWGTILAVGPGFRGRRSGVRHPIDVRVGDKVLYLREAVRKEFNEIEIGDAVHEKVSIVQQRDINLIIRDGEIIALNDYIVGQILPSEYEYEEIIDPVTRKKIRVYGKFIELGEGKRFFVPTQITDDQAVNTEKKPIRVKVTHVGPGRRALDTAVQIPMEVRPGDIVLCSKYMAWEFILDDTNTDTGHVVIKCDEVYGFETE